MITECGRQSGPAALAQLSAQRLMPTAAVEGNNSVQAQESNSRLLQLPEAQLAAVLQKLDICSLAKTSVSCPALSHAVPGSISTIAVRCTSPAKLASFIMWLSRRSFNHVAQCSVESDLESYEWGSAHCLAEQAVLHHLPCPQLRQLRLQNLKLQLQPAAGCSGVLQHCTGLTSLHLQRCLMCDIPAASAAIAALSQLQDLRMVENFDHQRRRYFAAAQLPTTLTLLELLWYNCTGGAEKIRFEQLTQLSALVNLQHLAPSNLSHAGVPGGLPSQLVKLTCLDIQYEPNGDTAEQFRHLSALTALQQLRIEFLDMQSDMPEDHLSGISHLNQLTSLQLRASFYVGSETTTAWARLTALHSLSLSHCELQPSALAPLAQLQSLWRVELSDDGSSHDLLVALSHLTALTALNCNIYGLTAAAAPAAAFTAITASTHLRSLDAHFDAPPDIELFPAGAVYPHLRKIYVHKLAPSQQLLQHMVSSCPAVERLGFALRTPCAPTACLPLLQLSALTHLLVEVCRPRGFVWPPRPSDATDVADTAMILLGVAAQLTGLKSLSVKCDCHPSPFEVPQQAVLQLTSLTALECLSLDYVRLNKASIGHPPDVSIQLLRHLAKLGISMPADGVKQPARTEPLA